MLNTILSIAVSRSQIGVCFAGNDKCDNLFRSEILFWELNILANWDLPNVPGDLFVDSFVLELNIGMGCELMLLSKLAPGSPLLF